MSCTGSSGALVFTFLPFIPLSLLLCTVLPVLSVDYPWFSRPSSHELLPTHRSLPIHPMTLPNLWLPACSSLSKFLTVLCVSTCGAFMYWDTQKWSQKCVNSSPARKRLICSGAQNRNVFVPDVFNGLVTQKKKLLLKKWLQVMHNGLF